MIARRLYKTLLPSKLKNASMSDSNAKLTREHVFSTYKEMLRRPPESEEAIELHLSANHTFSSFRKMVAQSEEFKALSVPYPGRKIVLSDVDAEIGRLESLEESATFDVLQEMNSFWLEVLPTDAEPFSLEYAQWVMETYRSIANRSYSTANEASTFLTDDLAVTPFPYATKNPRTVGDQLMAIGHVIQSMDLPAGSSILELGFGWGNTSLHLARMGYAVTGIDIEAKYVEMVRHQSALLSLSLDLRQGSFFDIELLDQKFDAVLFFESFHHCSDHVRLLKAIPALLKDGGKLVLAGETINNRLPYPWGINPSGQAVYCIRKFGWLELCFREDYLFELLDNLGWDVVKHNFASATAITYIATRKSAGT